MARWIAQPSLRRETGVAEKRASVIVIGAGLMGAATTLALARRGHAVLALEARAPGHREGSSHGSTRIVRRSYLDPDYLEMTGRAFELWRELEQCAGTRLLTMTGALECGVGRQPKRLHEALTAAGVPCELVSPDAARERWPQVRLDGDVLYQADAGVVDPELAVTEMLRLAREAGARVEHETPVLSIDEVAGGIRVHTAAGPIAADVAVVAAGPWLSPLLAGVVDLPPLKVTQQQVFHFAPAEAVQAAGQAHWPAVVYGDGANSIYALPGGADGLVAGNMKIAKHDPGSETTADERDGLIDAAGRRRVVDHVRRSWPGLHPDPVAEYTCLYTWTPDEGFILDRAGPIVVCSPCSGHGAKFTPLVGEWAADLAEGRALPYARFGLDRFR
jgi:sarcosine oxidase